MSTIQDRHTMTRALILTTALLTACASPTREVCGTLPDGSEFCTIVRVVR